MTEEFRSVPAALERFEHRPRFVKLVLPILIPWNLFLFSPEVFLSLALLALIVIPFSLLCFARWPGYYGIGIAVLLVFFIDYRWESTLDLPKFALLSLIPLFSVMAAMSRDSFYVPLAVALAVMTLTTCWFLLTQPQATIAPFNFTRQSPDNPPPRLIHLVLDEHIGIEGFPSSMSSGNLIKAKVRRFYEQQGFKVYGAAYGHYFETYDAIPNFLNFSAEPAVQSLAVGKAPPYEVTRNQYFQLLQQRRYRLHVVGAGYLDFCTKSRQFTSDCQDYHSSSLASLTALDIPVLDKTGLLLGSFITMYQRYIRLLQLCETSFRIVLQRYGISFSLPADSIWTYPYIRPYSANAMQALDGLWKNLIGLPPGHAVFAHIMLPHSPYIYHRDCAPRRLVEWKERMDDIPEDSRTRTLREERYRLYFDQMECLLTKLQELFDQMKAKGIFNDSIIIVHGDHGSRLAMREPTTKTAALLTMSDLVDTFSLLYAVKLPENQGGYDATQYPIEDLLKDSLSLSGSTAHDASSKSPAPFVYLRPVGATQYRPIDIRIAH